MPFPNPPEPTEPTPEPFPNIVTNTYFMERLGLSRRSVFNRTSSERADEGGTFPKSIKVDGLNVQLYLKSDADRYIQERSRSATSKIGKQGTVIRVREDPDFKPPEIVGFKYFADRLGLAMQTIRQRDTEMKDFPESVKVEGRYRLWLRETADRWIDNELINPAPKPKRGKDIKTSVKPKAKTTTKPTVKTKPKPRPKATEGQP